MTDDSPSENYPKSARLTPEETAFLEDNNLTLKEVAQEGIKHKKKQIATKTKKQKINAALVNGIFLIIGILFIWTLNFTSSIISIGIIACMGVGFCLVGGLGLYNGMKQEGILVRTKK